LSDAAFGWALAAAFFCLCAVLAALSPDRVHWALENLLVAGLAAALWFGRAALPPSKLSSGLIFAFLCLHEIGSYYGYSAVPYEAWLAALTGGTTLQDLLGLERNHYDRLVHFMFGLLLTSPIREVLLRLTPVRGRWSYLLPVAISMAAAMAYEQAEWLVAALFGGDLATAYLGMQGDVWDAQKDMALGTAGAILAMILTTNLARREGAGEESALRKGAPAAAPVRS
jgi:putative membrane protein